VTRQEARASTPVMMMDEELVALFLQPDALVPIDGKPLTLLAGRSLPLDQLRLGRTLYDLVNSHMRYSKEGTGWGLGDAVWACDSRYGNCSDFHSLLSRCRARRVPAKFEIGFPLPPSDHGRSPATTAGPGSTAGPWWVPVDISEANSSANAGILLQQPDRNRVTFSVGRPGPEPPQAGPPLNFFVALRRSCW
jgi:transglutaminase-like putative cysteine protease